VNIEQLACGLLTSEAGFRDFEFCKTCSKPANSTGGLDSHLFILSEDVLSIRDLNENKNN